MANFNWSGRNFFRALRRVKYDKIKSTLFFALHELNPNFCLSYYRRAFDRKIINISLTYYSLTHNYFLDRSYVADTLMEPLFWFVDNFTKVLGPVPLFSPSLCTNNIEKLFSFLLLLCVL